MQGEKSMENFIQEKWLNRAKYKQLRIMVDRELGEFAEGYFDFNRYGNCQEFLSELVERELKRLYEEVKAKRITVLE
jgi:hypothetical protein